MHGDESSLPDEVDQALEALWHGDSGKMDHLIGTIDGTDSTIGRIVRAAAQLSGTAEQFDLPRDIDDFTIEGEIGRGGMGVVLRARQKHPDRVVAIKLIRPGKLTTAHQRRFRYEADILASLTHPGIASIYQAGLYNINGKSQPYIVMEMIDGQPLTDYATHHRLTTRDRISLFLHACDAVHYAHQRGVIHRDLKPENILVAAGHSDDAPVVKLLDFGVASSRADISQTDQPHTADSSFIGTMLYMSPEQVDGDPVDVSSDVYSLGVLLYELLLDRLPYDVEGQSPAHIIDAIRTQGPVFTNPCHLPRDLELIIRAAMTKDKQGRYPSAHALAADLRRYLGHEPIVARPPSATYQIAKFTRRNPLLVGSTAALALTLLSAVVIISMLLVQTSAAREAEAEQRFVAEQETAKQQAVVRFLQDTLAAADPVQGTGDPDVTLREVLDRAAAALVNGHDWADPAIQATLYDTIGEVYVALNLLDEGESMYLAAQEIRQTIFDHDHPDHATSVHQLGTIHLRRGENDLAYEMLDRALRMREMHFGQVSEQYATTLNNLSIVMTNRGDFQQAHQMQQRTLDIRREALAADDPLIGQAMNNVGVTLYRLGRYAEAKEKLERTLAFQTRLHGNNHPAIAQTLANLALIYQLLELYDAAEDAGRRSVALYRDAYGEEHPALAPAIRNLATLMFYLKEYESAIEWFEQALEIQENALGSSHQATIQTRNDIAVLLSLLEHWDEAEATMREVLDLRLGSLHDDHPHVANSHATLGRLLFQRDQYDEAEKHLRRAYDMRVVSLGYGHPRTISTTTMLADLFLATDQVADAEEILLAAAASIADSATPVNAARSVFDALIELYEQSDRPEHAARYVTKRDDLAEP